MHGCATAGAVTNYTVPPPSLADDARQVYPERRSPGGRLLGRWSRRRCYGTSSGTGKGHASLYLLRSTPGIVRKHSNWYMGNSCHTGLVQSNQHSESHLLIRVRTGNPYIYLFVLPISLGRCSSRRLPTASGSDLK